jgi:hypothetical protein
MDHPMTRILFVGQKPETVDFSDPALPPGFDATKINTGIAVAMAKIAERGWQGDQCMIPPDDTGWRCWKSSCAQRATIAW